MPLTACYDGKAEHSDAHIVQYDVSHLIYGMNFVPDGEFFIFGVDLDGKNVQFKVNRKRFEDIVATLVDGAQEHWGKHICAVACDGKGSA